MSTLSGKYSVNGNLSILNGMSCKNGTIDFEGASFVNGCIPSNAVSGITASTTQPAGDNTTKIATTEFVQTAVSLIPKLSYLSDMVGPTIQTQINNISSSLSGYLTTSYANSTYAPIASPTFTGTPILETTPLTEDDSTAIATTGYVKNNLDTYVSIDSDLSKYIEESDAESTYISKATLNEYITTSDAESTYAPIASPTFTGTLTGTPPTEPPKAPTQATDDNSNAIATTAYVKNNINTLVVSSAPEITSNLTLPSTTGYTLPTSSQLGGRLTGTISGKSSIINADGWTTLSTLTNIPAGVWFLYGSFGASPVSSRGIGISIYNSGGNPILGSTITATSNSEITYINTKCVHTSTTAFTVTLRGRHTFTTFATTIEVIPSTSTQNTLFYAVRIA